MPRAQVRVFRGDDGQIPLKVWLDGLKTREPKRRAKCLAYILRLSNFGSALRRPDSAYLRDGIYELRPVREVRESVHYRILYFFTGKEFAILSHGISKKGKVPENEIELAIRRKNLVLKDSTKYTADLPQDDDEENC